VKMSALRTVFIASVLLIALAGCGEKATTTTTARNNASTETAAVADSQPVAAAEVSTWTGKIKETMNSGGYTYILVDTGSAEIWAAGPETVVAVGQEVTVPQGMVMNNFRSKTLDRVFKEIHFVNGIYPAGEMPDQRAGSMGSMGTMPKDANHAGVKVNSNTRVADAGIEDVAKADDGYTIAELYKRGPELNGQTVKVRGRVVKFSANIMGTNWIHIQDNTPGDLTVTSKAKVATGDVVLVEGTLASNKDFGAGYRYEVIIEKASVIKD